MSSLGARLLEIFPEPPLFGRQGLGVAVMSYDGRICFGLAGDYDLVPDLSCLGEDIVAYFGELQATAAGL